MAGSGPELTAEQQAKAVAAGGETDVARVETLARELRKHDKYDVIAPMLVAASRRALYDGWETAHRVQLARTLRDHDLFSYARRLLGRVRREEPDTESLRQQHALCTYKDKELPAVRRLDLALAILREGGALGESKDAETLGLAGAIFKRKWEVDAKRGDLESALWCYERGFAQEGHRSRAYCGINAAFVSDQLAELSERSLGRAPDAGLFRTKADEIRRRITESELGDDEWADATHGEAFFGLGDFDAARRCLAEARRKTVEIWRLETTAMQLGALARLRHFERADAAGVLEALLGSEGGAVQRAFNGKIGLALSGGGFRASLFHIGVLARLAECNVLRRVEVLSCVSGGSIVGAYYYLKLRRLLERKTDGEITDSDYVKLVGQVADEFLDSVRKDLRGRLVESVVGNFRMLSSRYSRTDRAADLLQELIYSKVPKAEHDEPTKPWRMTDLHIRPKGWEGGFSLRYENWRRDAVVPMLVLNATSLNTGHNWQFTASWMGEPPVDVDEKVDATPNLRRVYYEDASPANREPRLAKAVAASACVPGIFPPITIEQLYPGIDVELVDGGAYDNQGVASLLEQDCTVIIVSDASGQIRDNEHPARSLLGVANRSNSVLMSRVRGAQYELLASRLRSGRLRRLVVVHLRKGLWSAPVDWIGCQEPYDPCDDGLPADIASAPSAYGIDPAVQRGLAQLRTDLDAFSNDEAYSLMAAGYAMAGRELEQSLPELAVADPELAKTVEWSFKETLTAMRAPPPSDELADALAIGGARMFRRFKGWRARREREPKGAARAALGRTAAGAARAAARGAETVVVSPLRKIVSAPLAVVGGLASRLYLRHGRRRKE
jgi:predicted acylesterase/phospholipase RssA